MAPLSKPYEPEEWFWQVSGKRARALLKAINKLKQCASLRRYNYTRRDVDSLFKEIDPAYQEMKIKFQKELEKSGKDPNLFDQ